MSAPCSLNAKGARRSPILAPGLDITSCDFQFSNSLAESWNMKSAATTGTHPADLRATRGHSEVVQSGT